MSQCSLTDKRGLLTVRAKLSWEYANVAGESRWSWRLRRGNRDRVLPGSHVFVGPSAVSPRNEDLNHPSSYPLLFFDVGFVFAVFFTCQAKTDLVVRRVQGNKKGVESTQEGGGNSAQGRRGTSTPSCRCCRRRRPERFRGSPGRCRRHIVGIRIRERPPGPVAPYRLPTLAVPGAPVRGSGGAAVSPRVQQLPHVLRQLPASVALWAAEPEHVQLT